MNHSLLLLSVIFISSIPCLTGAVKCYQCSQVRNTQSDSNIKLCSHFDYSNDYVVDCPYSTMCVKKLSSVNITGQINVTSRGCALQKYEYQKYDQESKKWHGAIEVQEVYEEGCFVSDNKGLKISYTEFCYCRGDWCNSAAVRKPSIFILSVIMLVLYGTVYRIRYLT